MGALVGGLVMPVLTAMSVAPASAAGTTTVITAASPGDWKWIQDDPAVTPAPVIPPTYATGGTVGTSSASYPALVANQTIMISNATYTGTPLASITSLQYSTYSSSSTFAPQLAVEMKYTAAATVWQGRLVYVPAVGDVNVWKTWNTMDNDPSHGGWFASNAAAAGGKCAGSVAQPFCTWAQVLANFPDAQIGNPSNGGVDPGRLLVRVGDTGNSYANEKFKVDGIVVGVSGADKTFDFATTAAPVATTVTAGALSGWSWLEDDPNPNNVVVPQFTTGGSVGVGSATYPVIAAHRTLMISRSDLSGTKLADISSLQYATKSSNLAPPALGLEMKYTATDSVWMGRLVFVPKMVSGDENVWKTWNTLDPAAGGWYSTNSTVATATGCTLGTPCPMSTILAKYPQAEIGNPSSGGANPGRLVIRASGTTNDFSRESFDVDGVVVGAVKNGVDTTTSYDFETTAAAATKVVTAGALTGWSWIEDEPNSNAPVTPVFTPGGTTGVGSAAFPRLNANQTVMISRADLSGTKLRDISALSYDAWASRDIPALSLEMKYTASAIKWQGRLVFIPNPALAQTGWHTWNALDPAAGGWYASKTNSDGTNGLCPMGTPCTWAQVLADFPQAEIGNPDANNIPLQPGRVLFHAGSTNANYTKDDFRIDNVVIGTVGTGGVDTKNTYDFETTSAAAVNTTVTASALNGWSWIEDDPTLGQPAKTSVTPVFTAGPAGQPAGAGSATYAPLGNHETVMISRPDYSGTKLSAISKLNYSTDSTKTNFAPQLGLEMKYTPESVAWQGRLVYVPGGDTSGWHTWNTMDNDPTRGGWYASNSAAGGKCAGSVAFPLCTWAQVLQYFPQALIGNGANAGTDPGRLIVRVGDTTQDYSAATFNVDNISVGVVAAGGVETVKTFDFEPLVATAPTNVVATATNGAASVSWTAPSTFGTSPLLNYTVTGGGTCVITGTTASCTGLTNGTTYTFTVQAVTASGTGAGAASNAVTPITIPAAPTGVTATAGDAQAVIAWVAPSNGGSAITGYTVTAAPGGATCTTTTLTCTVTGLTNGTTFTFTVKATNAAGAGPASSGATATPAAQVASEAPAVVLDYNPVGPKRVFDTRPGGSPEALRVVPKTQVGGTNVLEVPIAGLTDLVPSTGVGAVSLNVTVTGATTSGFVTVYPCGNREVVSSVNFTPGTTVANGVITPLSATGTVCFYSNNPVDIITDVNGWFAAGKAFVPVGPKRVLDTRNGMSPDAIVNVSKTQILGGTFIQVPFSPLGGVVPATGVGTVSLNVTAVDPAAAGFITAYACGTREEVSSLNYTAHSVVANQVLVPLSATGSVCFFSAQNVDLVVDINGYLKAGSGFTGVGPRRLVDTRAGMSANALLTVAKTQIGGATVLQIPVTGIAGVTPASGVGAVSLNVTATNPALDGFITVYPCGTRGEVSSLNYAAGQTVANAVLTPISATGMVCIYSQRSTDVVIDINGWFANTATS